MRSLCQVVIKPDLDAEHKGLIASLPHELTLGRHYYNYYCLNTYTVYIKFGWWYLLYSLLVFRCYRVHMGKSRMSVFQM